MMTAVNYKRHPSIFEIPPGCRQLPWHLDVTASSHQSSCGVYSLSKKLEWFSLKESIKRNHCVTASALCGAFFFCVLVWLFIICVCGTEKTGPRRRKKKQNGRNCTSGIRRMECIYFKRNLLRHFEEITVNKLYLTHNKCHFLINEILSQRPHQHTKKCNSQIEEGERIDLNLNSNSLFFLFT